MPTRMPKTFKTSSFRRDEAKPTHFGGTTTTPLRGRIAQSGIYRFVAGGFLIIMGLITEAQYGYSLRFKDNPAGASLKAIILVNGVVNVVVGLYTFAMWWLDIIMSSCIFHTFGFMSVIESLLAVWACVIDIMALAFTSTTTASLSYSSGQRTLLIVLTISLFAIALMSIAFTCGVIQYWNSEKYNARHARPTVFSTIAPSGSRRGEREAARQVDVELADEAPQPPARTRPSAPALPAPGEGGQQPVFYVGAGAGAGASARSVDQPVHDETTRALFAHLWQSMKEVGSFECPVSHVPGLPTLVSHLRGHGFQPLMTGDDGKERKVYFYTEEVLEGNRVMVFLAEFKFALSAGVLTAAFKCHNPEQMEYVKQFHLEQLFKPRA